MLVVARLGIGGGIEFAGGGMGGGGGSIIVGGRVRSTWTTGPTERGLGDVAERILDASENVDSIDWRLSRPPRPKVSNDSRATGRGRLAIAVTVGEGCADAGEDGMYLNCEDVPRRWNPAGVTGAGKSVWIDISRTSGLRTSGTAASTDLVSNSRTGSTGCLAPYPPIRPARMLSWSLSEVNPASRAVAIERKSDWVEGVGAILSRALSHSPSVGVSPSVPVIVLASASRGWNSESRDCKNESRVWTGLRITPC